MLEREKKGQPLFVYWSLKLHLATQTNYNDYFGVVPLPARSRVTVCCIIEARAESRLMHLL